MQGYEAPKILKLPQGETRWAPRRLPVDVGDVMMNIRMDDSKNKYIGEHVSKYAQGLNPYGEWNYPYKVNKNNIRPPIIDPKFYEPLSRMPVKFDAVTAGPIVKDLYGKRVDIAKVAPQTIIDKVCPDAAPRPSVKGKDNNSYHEGSINLHLKQPRASIPYHPSIPVHVNTGVPQVELDGKMLVRPQMGIHAPFTVSDQSRDINNMRTPMHVAVKPGYKDPYTFVQPTVEDVQGINDNMQHVAAASGFDPGYTLEPEINTNIPLEPGVQTAAQSNIAVPVPTVSNLTRDGYDLTPKVQTSAWYNPSYYLTDLSGYNIGNVDETCIDNKVQTTAQAKPTMQLVDMTDRQMSERIDPMIEGAPIHTAAKAPSNYKMVEHGGHDVPITTRQALNAARQTNVSSRHLQEGEIGEVSLPDAIHAGEFGAKAVVPSIQEHLNFNRARETTPKEYLFVENHGKYGDAIPGVHSMDNASNHTQPMNRPRTAGVRERLQLQAPRIDRQGLEPAERIVPVGTGRFVQNTF